MLSVVRSPCLGWCPRSQTEVIWDRTCVSRLLAPVTIVLFHNEVEIKDFQYDEDLETYFYPCLCGDNFFITKEAPENDEDVATCPSCFLIIKVIYDKDHVWRNSPSPINQQRIS
uniref:Diphthamide biosynthesis protein 3 n=1 Tax=Oryctolagus cuniculus TaxID=9986 RepID=A0A5F9D1B5_RABIT